MRLPAVEILITLICCAAPWGCRTPEKDLDPAGTYQLYFLGGQSNMDGYGLNADLPEELRSPQREVIIFHGNGSADNEDGSGTGVWSPMQPGHGTGFTSDGKTNHYSDRFGPELTFGSRLSELQPGAKIAVIKYSRGGSSLGLGASEFGTWDPDFRTGAGINQYDHFLSTVRNALDTVDLDGDGRPERFVPAGIIWMQGEADAFFSEASAREYGSNLKRLIDLMRAAFRVDDLPVVIGQISDSGHDEDGMMMDYADIVRAAQVDFVSRDVNAALVTSADGYAFIDDGWHFDSKGYLDLGRRFAEAVHALHTHK